jgi:ubiquinone/menaquinone biosynthesis C-methylase UbiE
MTEENGRDTYLLGNNYNAFRRYRLFNEIYQPGTLERFATLPVSPDMHLLEVGCGIGDTACYMAQTLVPEGHVTAIDPASDLVDLAKRQASKLGIRNITFLNAKAEDFSYETASFDITHTRYVLSYLSDAGEVLQKVFDALKPSGIFFGEEIAQHYIKHGRTKWYDDMAAWFAKLIEAGGGNSNYGIEQMASDMLTAGFEDLRASAYWPIQDQPKIIEMLRLGLSQEMKQNLVRLEVATETEVDAVISELAAPEPDYVISAAMAAQIVGRKPQR